MYNKLSENFNFKFFKKYNLSELIQIVDSFDAEWRLDTSRQNNKTGAHMNTNTYYIKSFSPGWEPNTPLNSFPLANNVKVLQITKQIINDLEIEHNGKCSLAMIARLLPDSDIIPHEDNTDYLGIARRHHIPLKTNDNVFFSVGGEVINMQVGECWEINNSRTHFVENKSSEDRIHLIIDIVPNNYIKD